MWHKGIQNRYANSNPGFLGTRVQGLEFKDLKKQNKKKNPKQARNAVQTSCFYGRKVNIVQQMSVEVRLYFSSGSIEDI